MIEHFVFGVILLKAFDLIDWSWPAALFPLGIYVFVLFLLHSKD